MTATAYIVEPTNQGTLFDFTENTSTPATARRAKTTTAPQKLINFKQGQAVDLSTQIENILSAMRRMDTQTVRLSETGEAAAADNVVDEFNTVCSNLDQIGALLAGIPIKEYQQAGDTSESDPAEPQADQIFINSGSHYRYMFDLTEQVKKLYRCKTRIGQENQFQEAITYIEPLAGALAQLFEDKGL